MTRNHQRLALEDQKEYLLRNGRVYKMQRLEDDLFLAVGKAFFPQYRKDGTSTASDFISDEIVAKATDMEPFDLRPFDSKYIEQLTDLLVSNRKHVMRLKGDVGFRKKAIELANDIARRLLLNLGERVYNCHTTLLFEAAVYLLAVRGIKFKEERSGGTLLSVRLASIH